MDDYSSIGSLSESQDSLELGVETNDTYATDTESVCDNESSDTLSYEILYTKFSDCVIKEEVLDERSNDVWQTDSLKKNEDDVAPQINDSMYETQEYTSVNKIQTIEYSTVQNNHKNLNHKNLNNGKIRVCKFGNRQPLELSTAQSKDQVVSNNNATEVRNINEFATKKQMCDATTNTESSSACQFKSIKNSRSHQVKPYYCNRYKKFYNRNYYPKRNYYVKNNYQYNWRRFSHINRHLDRLYDMMLLSYNMHYHYLNQYYHCLQSLY